MEYRMLGNTGIKVNPLGLGTEHLERKQKNIEQVMDDFIEAGLNYIDLLYVEPEYWDEYGFIYRKYREKFTAAIHWGPNHDLEYSKKCLDNMLLSLGSGYAEVVMITVVDDDEAWNGWGLRSLEILNKYKEKGKIGFIGMSGHTTSVAEKVVRSDAIDVLMFPVNPMNYVYSVGVKELFQLCKKMGVGLVGMKPYGGGTMLYLDGKATGITPVQSISYALSLPVSTIVPGVKNSKELKSTLKYLEASEDEKDYSSIMDNIHESMAGHCTYCNHCLPCPQDIDIGSVICLTDWAKAGLNDSLVNSYAKLSAKASDCIECGQCVERCPFDVDIIERLKKATEVFEVGNNSY
ncbi:hypothetical protein GF312_01995 [Candidatus Poribacteria bacterium]|nr:hypothetical protein [Candidatus Poribacteria bacterium]